MEKNILRKLRDNMKRLKKEDSFSLREEKFRLPLLSSITEKQRRAEAYKVSRLPEIHMGQDLNIKIRSRQIVQTKTEHLEGDLKRAREQSYMKTMELSKLLSEKQALELQIQELTNANVQLAKQKEKLCEEYEEKLSRKNNSDDSGQLQNLRGENEKLSCKLQKCAAEKAELLRENNDLKEELYRKTAVMSRLVLEKEELKIQTEVLTFKNLGLIDEKEELCREYEEKLWREKQLRKGSCTLLMDRDQMDQQPCNIVITENKAEACDKMKPKMELSKKWLKTSIDSLKVKKSKEPGRNILRWLQQSLKILKEDSSELATYTLPEWLEASMTNLPNECAEASRKDVTDWLDASLNHLQEEGPETCDLDVEEWLEASIIGIQHLQKYRSKSQRSPRKGWLENSVANLKKQP